MKKVYTHPDIAFESFSLSTSIAACGFKVTTQYSGQCGFPYGNRTIFLQEVTGCNSNGGIVIEDGSPFFNNLCYHVPTGSASLFNS